MYSGFAQSPLQKSITIQAKNQRLANVLEIISNTGNFNFSYNSKIIKRDSLVTFVFTKKPIKEILDYIFKLNYEYIESGNYIIIRKKTISLPSTQTIVKSELTSEKKYLINGYIIDETSGDRIGEASIYEATQLTSYLSKENGFFEIKLKSKYKTAAVTVSKLFYKDTTIFVEPKLNQTIYITLQREEDSSNMVNVTPEDFFLPDSVEVATLGGEKVVYTKIDSIKVQKSWVGKFLLSSEQKIQSINLKNFFTTRKFQLSFLPGLSTQGKLSSQVTNNFSLNVLGGYTRSVKDIEIAGLFNINKKDVKGFQVAGLLNTVGGAVKGFQVAGIQNLVYDSVKAFQVAGVSNYIKGKFNGVQIAGIYNHQSNNMQGLQIAGISNYSKKNVKGLQMSGILNYAKKLNGVQIGLINISDTSNGYSIGLFNFVKNGYHKITVSTNETIDFDVAFKSGNNKLYSIIEVGTNFSNKAKLYSFGYGIGKVINIKKKISILTELTSQNLYAGSWDYYNLLNKFSLNLQWQLAKKISFFVGPSFSIFTSNQHVAIIGYKFPMINNGIKVFDNGKNTSGRVGLTLGINIL